MGFDIIAKPLQRTDDFVGIRIHIITLILIERIREALDVFKKEHLGLHDLDELNI